MKIDSSLYYYILFFNKKKKVKKTSETDNKSPNPDIDNAISETEITESQDEYKSGDKRRNSTNTHDLRTKEGRAAARKQSAAENAKLLDKEPKKPQKFSLRDRRAQEASR